jgi:hypothetical protein
VRTGTNLKRKKSPVEPYALIPAGGPFAASVNLFTSLVEELHALDAAGLTACELEDLLSEGGGPAATAARPPGPAGGTGGAGRPGAPPACNGRGRDHAEPTGDRPRQAAGQPVRHGAGHPVRLAPPGGAQPLPGRRRLVAAGLPAFPCPGPAAAVEAARGSFEAAHAALTGRCGPVMGKRQFEQAVVSAAADIAAFYAARVPVPCTADAAGTFRRCQGDRDAARSAAPGDRQGRQPPGQDADPAGGRGETEPQEDGYPGLRLRRRASPAPPARRDRPARRAPRSPHAPPQAQGEGEMAGRIGGTRPCRGHRRRLQPGRSPRPGPPADLDRPGRRR